MAAQIKFEDAIMARTTKTTASGTRASKKAEGGATSKKQAAPAARSTQKTRAPSRRRASSEPSSQSWIGLLSDLITSPLGREILADVLIAAAAALKKDRPTVQQAFEDGVQKAAQAGATAVGAGSDVASATATLAQSAAGALAEVVTDAARDILPGSPTKKSGSGSTRGRRKRA